MRSGRVQQGEPVAEGGRENFKFSLPHDTLEVNHVKYVAWCWKNLKNDQWEWYRQGGGFVVTFHNRQDYMMFLMVWG